ncbi:hypothetical protein ES708_14512 [subsurface metagenome]
MSNAPTVTEVLQFIKDLAQPEKLLEGCRRFHEIEPRDIAYVVCSKVISQDPKNTAYVFSGIRVFLQVWNAVYIQRLSPQLKQSMEDEIRDAYSSCSDELALLSQQRLEDIDLTSAHIAEAIRKSFRCFARCESIRDAGASKALHMLNPALFMMWDTKIRKAYSKLIPDELGSELLEKVPDEWKKKFQELPPYGRRNVVKRILQDTGESYLQFMTTCQVIMQALLKDITVAQLWSQHLQFMRDPEFARAWAFSETLVKMIDECNFVRWTRGIRFDC